MKNKIHTIAGLILIGIAFLFAACDGINSLAGDRNEIWQTVKERSSYTVEFDSKGGTYIPQQVVPYGGKAARPDNPKYEGYSFVQWSKEDGGEWDFDSDVILKNITLSAKWTELGVDKINISFVPNNGSSMNDMVVKIGERIVQPEGLTLTRSYLEGWYTSSVFYPETKWNFGDPAPDSRSLTLYAKWAVLPASQYTVWFIADGGFPAPYDYHAEGGAKINPPPVMERGGSGISADTFGGWYQNAEKTIPWIFEINTVTDSMPLYAQWNSYMQFSVNFWAGPADAYGHSGSPLWHQKIVTGGTPITGTIPIAKTGYTVEGWYTGLSAAPAGVSGEWNMAGSINQNYILQAKWAPISYKVTFNANEGSGTMAEQSFTYDGEKALSANTFTRSGYDFAGWNTKADGTGTGFSDSQNINNTNNLSAGAEVTLYAQWTVSLTDAMNLKDFGPGITPTVYNCNSSDLESVLKSIATTPGNYVVNVTGNASIGTANINFQGAGIYISLRGNGGTISGGDNGRMFGMRSGVRLILRDITLDGGNSGGNSLLYVSGSELIMEAGAVITGAYRGAVWLDSGNFIMNGGEISGNTLADGYSIVSIAFNSDSKTVFRKNAGAVIYGQNGPTGKANTFSGIGHLVNAYLYQYGVETVYVCYRDEALGETDTVSLEANGFTITSQSAGWIDITP